MSIDFGEIAYEAYCKASKNKSLISGAKLPKWKDVRPDIKSAWRDSAAAVLDLGKIYLK